LLAEPRNKFNFCAARQFVAGNKFQARNPGKEPTVALVETSGRRHSAENTAPNSNHAIVPRSLKEFPAEMYPIMILLSNLKHVCVVKPGTSACRDETRHPAIYWGFDTPPSQFENPR
jgi:hypothetical protein